MTDLGDIRRVAATHRLAPVAWFSAETIDHRSGRARSVVLLGPAEPGFWPHVTGSREFADGRPDPLDRWSKRVSRIIAEEFSAVALFPSDGPPYPPFIAWALNSNQVWQSPAGMLVDHASGLFVSFRSALALPTPLTATAQIADAPCQTCADQPCLTSCPAGAIGDRGYDLTLCHDFLDTRDGQDCLANGCAVRRACPASAASGRLPEQSAFHMKAFHPCAD